jgi:16S rRNA (cytosine967-C5)-methyltransferase
MTPAARAQAAIDILAAASDQPLDRFLKSWFRDRRYAGSKDRRDITERVFAIYRNRAALAHRMGSDTPRALVIASLLAAGVDPAPLFSGGYGPEALTEVEQRAIAAPPSPAPVWVQQEFPQWLEAELTRAFDGRLAEEMRAFQDRAPVDLRVNILKATRDDVLAALQAEGVDAAPTPHSPWGIRCAPGVALASHPLFLAGAFEVQDEAAQVASALAGAKPGQRVLDLAAGSGGKALALAAAMQNQGEIVACDIRGEALHQLELRRARAGASIIRTHILGAPPEGPFDIVFVDAPCSGSGTWRRQPELKWRLTPARLAGLRATQEGLLAQGADLTGPGGRLVYATCSVLPSENQDRVEDFLAAHPGFSRIGPDFHASPAATGTDGFYAAVLERA